jgi:hypothetical protein
VDTPVYQLPVRSTSVDIKYCAQSVSNVEFCCVQRTLSLSLKHVTVYVFKKLTRRRLNTSEVQGGDARRLGRR